MDNSKVVMAWNLTSAASNLCQTLGYHRQNPLNIDDLTKTCRNNLFWTVYKLDKGLSLRLGRPSNIPEVEISLPPDINEPRCVTVARIQGKIYDQLYSPMALSRPDDCREELAENLATEVQDLIRKCKDEELVRFKVYISECTRIC